MNEKSDMKVLGGESQSKVPQKTLLSTSKKEKLPRQG